MDIDLFIKIILFAGAQIGVVAIAGKYVISRIDKERESRLKAEVVLNARIDEAMKTLARRDDLSVHVQRIEDTVTECRRAIEVQTKVVADGMGHLNSRIDGLIEHQCAPAKRG